MSTIRTKPPAFLYYHFAPLGFLISIAAASAAAQGNILKGSQARGDGERAFAARALRWGRLVDVHAKGDRRAPEAVDSLRDIAVGEAIGISKTLASEPKNPVTFTIREEPASGLSILTIGAAYSDANDSDFQKALREARGALRAVEHAEAPSRAVPLDAALEFEFSAAVDPRSIGRESLQIYAGPSGRHAPGRYIWSARRPNIIIFDPALGRADLTRRGDARRRHARERGRPLCGSARPSPRGGRRCQHSRILTFRRKPTKRAARRGELGFVGFVRRRAAVRRTRRRGDVSFRSRRRPVAGARRLDPVHDRRHAGS